VKGGGEGWVFLFFWLWLDWLERGGLAIFIIIFLFRFSLQKDKNKNGNNKTWGEKKSLSQSRKFIIFGFVVLSLVFFLSSFLFYIGE